MSSSSVYLLPGRSNSLREIGKHIAGWGLDVCGRELVAPFASWPFSDQLSVIKQDLNANYWHEDAHIIGHSYGGYLLLHALAELPPFPGHVLLLSPVLGAAIDPKNFMASYPPRAKRLLELARAEQFPIPNSLLIHTGAADSGCDPRLAERLGQLLGGKVHVVAGQGHELAPAYVECVLRDFLAIA